ncbi:MAG: DNA polymerase III subunit delta [Candidatus Komeilibacteria bacterium]|nr:DNA polymerase III subunit delta [Candidatus Komeilibacteria bacterium]
MLFFYYGQDSFRANQKVRAIKNKFKEKVDPSGHNVQHLDGELISPDDFFQAVSVMGFLADKKLIIIKNIFDNKKLKDWQDQLIKFLDGQADSPDENYIIFLQTSKPDSRLKLYKKLSKLKFSEEFEILKPVQLKTWVQKQFSKHSKTINLPALELLITYVGNNLWQINNEINKLVSFTKNDVSEEDIRALVQAKVDENIFNLIDAIGNKNKALALQLIEEKLDSGVNHQYILTMIIRQYRLLIKAKSLGSKAKNYFALMQVLKVPKFIAQKTYQQSALYKLDQLKKIYKYLLYLDEKFKSSSGQEKILFAKMINDL